MNLATQEAEVAQRYLEGTLAWLKKRKTGQEVRAKISAQDEERLQGLGYGGGDDDSQ